MILKSKVKNLLFKVIKTSDQKNDKKIKIIIAIGTSCGYIYKIILKQQILDQEDFLFFWPHCKAHGMDLSSPTKD